MLRFRSLGSGSTGNATLVETREGTTTTRLLVDCGFGLRQLEQRLGGAELTVRQIDAVFITHEHSDHVGCVAALARRHQIPVWMSRGTFAAIGEPDFDGMLNITGDLGVHTIGACEIRPFTVPHDAREPLQLRCTDGASHLGILTDLGHASAHVLQQLEGCHALLLESNHDPDMLAVSRYPEFLKRRVGGRFGHLANGAAADIARHLNHVGLRHVVAAHLSEQNNHAALVRQGLAAALGWPDDRIEIADPRSGTDWLEL